MASTASAGSPPRRIRGSAPAIFAEMLGQFGRLRRDEFELDDARYELAHEVDRWRARALELARGRKQGSDFGLDL